LVREALRPEHFHAKWKCSGLCFASNFISRKALCASSQADIASEERSGLAAKGDGGLQAEIDKGLTELAWRPVPRL
jgi:hypothetical protein